MLDPRKKTPLSNCARVKAIALVILLASLSQLLSQVPTSVSAWEESHVHPRLSREAAELLPLGSAMHGEIFDYMDDIEFGSEDEDNNDVIYDLPGLGIRCLPHFWDADMGPDDPVHLGVLGYPNAYQKSVELLRKALYWYGEGRPWRAYRLLGRIAHLIEDQCVPAHVHEDMHPGFWAGEWAPFADTLGGGDDSLEDWFYESGEYLNWGDQSTLGAGMIKFPDEVEEEMRGGDQTAGMYYLMYTTNQVADYFASDHCDGDTDDPEGWMDYSDFPTWPTEASGLSDNDRAWIPLTLAWRDDDNDEDGDLSAIISKTIPYGIRAVATLYKLFYEATHPPTASISIDFADADSDGRADYKWVKLDLTHYVGAGEYMADLEARYRNELGEWTDWQPVVNRKSWILSDGDGVKTVYYQVRNLMGQTTTDSDTVELLEIGEPLLFNFEFYATGYDSLSAHMEFIVRSIWASHSSGDGDLELWYRARIDDGHGNWQAERQRFPPLDGWDHAWYNVPIGEDFDLYEPDVIDVYFYDYYVAPDTTVRLRTHGWDYNEILGFPSGDDDLGTVWTDIYSVPTELGTHVLGSRYFGTGEDGRPNYYYELWIDVLATVTGADYSGHEGPYLGVVHYGGSREEAEFIQDSGLWADLRHTTEWQAFVDNDAVEYELRTDPDGYLRELWAWTSLPGPDMVVGGFSPVHLLITDPMGRRVGKGWYWTGRYAYDLDLGREVRVMEMGTFDEVPGASIIEIPIGADGDFTTLIVFDEREVGDYQIRATPTDDATLTDTYSILMLSRWRKSASLQPLEQEPPKIVYLAEDVQVAEIPSEPGEPYVIRYVARSSDASVTLAPRAEAGGPHKAREGTIIEFDAGGSVDPDGDPLTYRWNFGEDVPSDGVVPVVDEDGTDGTWDTEWSSSPTASHTWLDDWTGWARVQVNDGTFTDTSFTLVTIYNVAPTVDAGPSQLAAPGDEVHFSGSFADPGVDTHTIEWDFGDGTTVADTLTPNHTYTEARKHIVTLTITDDDGGVGIDTLTVNTGVEVSIDPQRAWVPAEEDETYHVLIQNLAKTKETYNLNISGLDATWYSLSTNSVTLKAGESESVTLTVSPPYTASTRSYEFTVVAISDTDPIILGTADAEVIVTPGDVELVGPLDVVVDVGSIHYGGETAEFYILASHMGEPIDANISAILRARGGTWFEDLSEYVEPIGTGLYRVPYIIPTDAPTGTYVLVVEASYFAIKGVSLRCFLLRPREGTTLSSVLAAAAIVVAVAALTGVALYARKTRKL